MFSRFDFLLRVARPFGFLVGLLFTNRRNWVFLDKVKAFIFATIESVIIALYISLTSFSTSKNIYDQQLSKF